MSKRFIFLVALFLSPAFFSCNPNEDENTDDTEEGINLTEGAEDASDYHFTESEATMITVNSGNISVVSKSPILQAGYPIPLVNPNFVLLK